MIWLSLTPQHTLISAIEFVIAIMNESASKRDKRPAERRNAKETKFFQADEKGPSIMVERQKIPIPDHKELCSLADSSEVPLDSADQTNIVRFAKTLEILRFFVLLYKDAAKQDQDSVRRAELLDADENEPHIEFGALGQKWESMEDVSIIRDALLSGHLSLATSFLQSRKFYQSAPLSTRSNLKQKRLKEEAFALVYQAITRNEIKIARKMLRSIDVDEVVHFREIFFRTCRRSIRHALLEFDQSRNILKLSDLPPSFLQTLGTPTSLS